MILMLLYNYIIYTSNRLYFTFVVSSPTTDDDRFLLVKYKQAFRDLQKFIELDFPLDNLAKLLEKNIIDGTVRVRIVNASSADQKSQIFMAHLLSQKANLNTCKAFLSLCAELRPQLANRIMEQIENNKE